MPTIVFVSPKGGVGKTTSALVLATQLARGTTVTVIDADPNHPIATWAKGGDIPKNLTITADAEEENIIEKIEEASSESSFVIVDLEGTASKIVVIAVSHADFVIVITQGSQLDAEQAGRALRVIQQHEKIVRRSQPDYFLPYAVLLTRTNPTIRARPLSHIENGLIKANIPVFETEMNEREAFRAIFSFQKTLARLSHTDVSNLDKAIKNAEALTHELIDKLRRKNDK